MNKTFSAIGSLLVIAVAVVFIVQFRPGSGAGGSSGSGPACAIEVQASCIPPSHFWAAYYLAGGAYFDSSQTKSMALRRQVTDGLIERQLLNDDAKRLGVTVSDDEVTRELLHGRAYVSLPADKMRELGRSLGLLSPQPGMVLWSTPFRMLQVKNPKTKAVDVATYEKSVRNFTKLSPVDYREFQKQEIIAARMRDLIRTRVHVSESEAYDEYARENTKASVTYIKLDRNFYADLFVDQDPKTIDEWTAKHTEELNKAWETRKSQYEGECRVARHILAKVAQDSSEEDKARAKKRIDKALAALKDGADFPSVARRFSDDGSATKGGDLGCAPRKQMVKPFEDALFAMEEGKVSDLVTSEFGYHIIQLVKIVKPEDVEREIKAQIARDQYLKLEAETKAAAGAKSILAAIKAGKSFDDALKAHIDELKAAASGDEKKDAEPAKTEEEQKESVPEDGVIENKPLSADTHPDRPLVQVTVPFNATGNPIPDAVSTIDLVKGVFKLEKPGETLPDIVPLRGGYAVVALKDKIPVKKEEWEKDRDKTIEAIRKDKQQEALNLYMQRLRQKAERETPIKRHKMTEEPPDDKDQGDDSAPEEGEP